MQSEESDAGIRYTYNISPSPPVEIDTPDLRAHVSQATVFFEFFGGERGEEGRGRECVRENGNGLCTDLS